jgi:itaconate CoA-transferase
VEVVALLDRAQIANARVNDMRDLWTHPQLQARSRWVDVSTSAGNVPALLPPGMTEANMGAVPALGQHTDSILAELGYEPDAIARLNEEGAV